MVKSSVELPKPELWEAGDQYRVIVDDESLVISQRIQQFWGSAGGFGFGSMGHCYLGWTRRRGFGVGALMNDAFGQSQAALIFDGEILGSSMDAVTQIQHWRRGVSVREWPSDELAWRVKPKSIARVNQRDDRLELQDDI